MQRKTVLASYLLQATLVAGVASVSFVPNWARADTPPAATDAEHGHHIRIRTAISYLRDAQWDLSHSDKAFYGLRGDALKAVTDSLKELHEAMGVTPDPNPKDAPDIQKKPVDTAS